MLFGNVSRGGYSEMVLSVFVQQRNKQTSWMLSGSSGSSVGKNEEGEKELCAAGKLR